MDHCSRKRLKANSAALLKKSFLIFPICALCAKVGFSADPFAEIIRKTEPLTPAEEQTKFHLPPGFEIQLVASEPDIGKPMNMEFDAKGRLWISQSREYPFPVLPSDNKDFSFFQ